MSSPIRLLPGEGVVQSSSPMASFASTARASKSPISRVLLDLCLVVQSQLMHQTCTMCFHGTWAEGQTAGNLGDTGPFGREMEDFLLTRCQAIIRVQGSWRS